MMNGRHTVVKWLITTVVIPAASATWLFGQFNLQHHYDLGRDIFTSTVEFFFQDTLGTTFGFADINYDSHHYSKHGATDLYFELARYFRTAVLSGNLSTTLQYNDGVIFSPGTDSTLFSAIYPAWLAGISYYFPSEKFSLSTDLLARYEDGDQGLTYQLTFVWFCAISSRVNLTGFFDLWNSEKEGTMILMTEPQMVYEWHKFGLGIEVEISRNFPGAWIRGQEYFDSKGNRRSGKVWFIPTVFIKYTFP